MKLPELPNRVTRYRQETVELRGLNLSDSFQDGDLAHCENLSTRRWPYMTTRRARAQLAGYENVTALTAWEKLIAVAGTELLYDGQSVGTVSEGAKQFAVLNTKLVIWPDKVYLDMDSLTLSPLGAELEGQGAEFTTDTMTVAGWSDLTEKFKAGDGVTISGCTDTENNKDTVIKAVTATTITVESDGFSEGTETGTVRIERKVPPMDFICARGNRLMGCSNETRSIYASSLGDPTNFFVYEGLSTDGYALAVGSEGDFTGCCALGDSTLFWKENGMHKLMGDFPAEYYTRDYNVEGLQAGSEKSLQVINETLFYLGTHGVHAYSGGTPVLISENFGERGFSHGVAGHDGERYYLSLMEGEKAHMMVYDIRRGVWLREDGTRCVDFARLGKELYMLAEGKVWDADSGEDDGKQGWSATFTPFYETLNGRKRYSRLLIRMELPKKSWMMAEIRCDGGLWRTAGRLIGQEHDTADLRLTVNRCDRFEIRLSGQGPCTVLGVSREFSLASER